MNKCKDTSIVMSVMAILAAAGIAFILLSDGTESGDGDAWSWDYAGVSYSVEFRISEEDCGAAHPDGGERIPLGVSGSKLEQFRDAAVPAGSCIDALADTLSLVYAGTDASSPEFLGYVLEFIRQNIAYSDDLNLYGMPDWIAYPEETLLNRAGDCEDMAILFTSLACRLGYSCGMALFDGHVIAMVSLDDYSPPDDWVIASYHVSDDGRTYYACDPTAASGCPVGCNDVTDYSNDKILAFLAFNGS